MSEERRKNPARLFRALSSMRHARRSLSGKLMIVMLATTAIALAAAGTALLLTDLKDNRASLADDLSTESGIISLAVQPALSFNDRELAQRTLNALQARTSIQAAGIYTADGALFVQYSRPATDSAPLTLPRVDPGVTIDGGRIDLVRPISLGSEILGAVYLRAQYDVNARVRAYLSVLGAVMLIGLVAALLAGAWLQRVVSQPMESMARVARQIVERRDYSFRADKTTDDEIGVVVGAFNNMLDEVQARSRALETSEKLYRAIGESIDYGVWVTDAAGRAIYISDSFLKLVGISAHQAANEGWSSALHPDDLADTMAAWRECAVQGTAWYREHRVLGSDGRYHAILAQGVPIRDESGRIERWAGINLDISRLKNTELALIEADRRKDEFLATLAHELRNPLAPIRNAVRILGSDAADERQRQWGREVIARQVQRMSLLLDDLLDVSRITRGQLELKRDYVDLRNVVSVAVETARPLLDAKRHHFTVSLPTANVKLDADPLRLSQVIGNLLTNAAKYTDSEGHIALGARVENAELVISIKDDGIGLAPEVIPGLFTMFSQVNSAIDRAEGGLGIGLALVKGLVALHGGRVQAHSDGLGRGSEFTVVLPHRVIAPADDAKVEPETNAANASDIRRARVLVVDDNRDAAESIGLILRLSGFEVDTAFSGADALDLGTKHRPQAVILDIGMPGMSGHEVARRMRLEAWGRHAALIALTGWGQDQDKQAARAAGFDAHLTKPVDPANLERVLSDLLAAGAPRNHASPSGAAHSA